VVRAAPLSSRPRHLSPLPPPSPSTPPPAPPDSPHAASPQAIPAAATPPPAHEPTARVPAAGWRGDKAIEVPAAGWRGDKAIEVPAAGWRGDKAIEVEQAPPPRWWRDGLDSRAIGASLCAPLDTATIRDAPAAARSRPPLPPSLRNPQAERGSRLEQKPSFAAPPLVARTIGRAPAPSSACVRSRRRSSWRALRSTKRRRRDHRRAEDSISLFHVSATCWPREESLLRQVPTWQIQTRVRTDTHMRHARKTARN